MVEPLQVLATVCLIMGVADVEAFAENVGYIIIVVAGIAHGIVAAPGGGIARGDLF